MDALNETADLAPEQQQVLSQDEVERLLAQVAEEENSVVVHRPAAEAERFKRESVQPYDFRNPVFLSSVELRRLRLRHEEFIRSLAARMSIFLRLDFSLQMSKLQTIPYRKFTEGLTNPTHLTLFKVEPLRGVGLLEIHPRLGLTIVDRLLGGPAHSVSHDHDLTDIELALLEQTAQLILGEWCNHWARIQELRPTILGRENNGRFVETSPHDTVMLALSMEARVGDCMEAMQIGLPCSTLEPLIRQLGQAVDHSDNIAEANQRCAPTWNPTFNDVKVPVTAEWNELEMSARFLAGLNVGDVIRLDPSHGERVTVRLAGMPKFNARLGTADKRWAVELTQPITNS